MNPPIVNDNPPFVKRILSSIFANSVLGECTVQQLAKELYFSEIRMTEAVKFLVNQGLIIQDDLGRLNLTDIGRSSIKVVMAGGVFDIIHLGHVYTLNKAKSLGDALIVSVARDTTVLKLRGKPPINDEDIRVRQVASIKAVDAAVLGSERDIYDTVERIRPDIITIGYDQKYDEEEMKKRSAERGVTVEVIRLDTPHPGIKSSSIKQDPRFDFSF
ncbi:MAG: adenylyltransferase/cytidyltransferase family protein [Nitrososphaerota archaeon]